MWSWTDEEARERLKQGLLEWVESLHLSWGLLLLCIPRVRHFSCEICDALEIEIGLLDCSPWSNLFRDHFYTGMVLYYDVVVQRWYTILIIVIIIRRMCLTDSIIIINLFSKKYTWLYVYSSFYYLWKTKNSCCKSGRSITTINCLPSLKSSPFGVLEEEGVREHMTTLVFTIYHWSLPSRTDLTT